jgi:eukaryotic-like serine/threonine-protein kinase
MRILAEHSIKGMVPYYKATEIPAMVVMEYIDGPNLKEAVESKNCHEWFDILFISFQISSIILSAHDLPERVLHRDIRPSNIMLKDYYSCNEYNVVVCDFDLSWYVDAIEQSIQITNATGYLAPEQLSIEDKRITTRSALVDSFGIGMTMYYLISCVEPIFSEQKHHDWEEKVKSYCNDLPCRQWHSLSNRFARIIINATRHIQWERWDMVQIRNEIKRLLDVVDNNGVTEYSELIAEELIYRSVKDHNYIYNNNDHKCSFELVNGLLLCIYGNEKHKSVELEVSWQSVGTESHKNIKKYLPQRVENLISSLKTNKWEVDNSSKGSESIYIHVYKSTDFIIKEISSDIKIINQIMNELTF